MAGKLALGIKLGVDFGSLDRDLRSVADRIEKTGKAAALGAGQLAGDLAGGNLDPGQIHAAVSNAGARVAVGMADGIRAASGLMLGFAARINKMMDKLVGSAVTIFRRLDDAIKSSPIGGLLDRLSIRANTFVTSWRKSLTIWDMVLRGGFGKTFQVVAKVVQELINKIFTAFEAALNNALTNAVAPMIAQLERINDPLRASVPLVDDLAAEIRNVAASAATVGDAIPAVGQLATETEKVAENAVKIGNAVEIVEKLATETGKAAENAAKLNEEVAKASDAIPPRSKVAGVGRRIGFKTQFIEPVKEPEVKETPVHVEKRYSHGVGGGGTAIASRGMRRDLEDFTLIIRVPLRLLAKIAMVGPAAGLAIVNAFRGAKNAIGRMGDVGKSSYRKLFESHNPIVASLLAITKLTFGVGKALLHIATLGVFRRKKKDVDSMNKSLGKTPGIVSRASGSILALGRNALVALGAFGLAYKSVGFLKAGVMAASDLNETVSRTQVVFGQSFGVVEAQANMMSKRFGIMRRDQLDIASGFGAMAQGAGMAEAESAVFAAKMTKLAADMSSSVNISFEEAGQKIRSALAGEAEPLRQFGVNVTETNVKAHALSTGLAKSSSAIDDQAKMMARASLITQGLSYAQGDMERTADSASNQFRKAGGGIAEFGERIGEFLLPGVRMVVMTFNNMLADVIEWFDASKGRIMGWGVRVGQALRDVISIGRQFVMMVGTRIGRAIAGITQSNTGRSVKEWASQIMDAIGVIARNFSTIALIVKLRVGEMIENTKRWLAALPQNFAIVGAWLLHNWKNLFVDLGGIVKAFFVNLVANAKIAGNALWDALWNNNEFKANWTPMLANFKSSIEDLPELMRPKLINVNEQVGDLIAKIMDRESKRKIDVGLPEVPLPPKKPAAVAEEKKALEYKLASAVDVTSKEAYSTIARTMTGSQGTTSAVNRNVKATQDVGKKIDKLTEAVKSKPDNSVFDGSGVGFVIR